MSQSESVIYGHSRPSPHMSQVLQSILSIYIPLHVHKCAHIHMHAYPHACMSTSKAWVLGVGCWPRKHGPKSSAENGVRSMGTGGLQFAQEHQEQTPIRGPAIPFQPLTDRWTWLQRAQRGSHGDGQCHTETKTDRVKDEEGASVHEP